MTIVVTGATGHFGRLAVESLLDRGVPADQIVATGKVQHAKLGVSIQDVNQGFADSFNLASPEGALIANVERGSAADRAGLKAGDVVRTVNGQAIILDARTSSTVARATAVPTCSSPQCA